MKKQLTILLFIVASTPLWALDAPVLTSPSTNYQNAFTRIILKGQNGEKDGYHIQVDTTKNFNSPLLKEEKWSKSVSTFSATITDLYFNAHYYWRVRSISATDSEVYSEWSETRDFYTNHPVEIVGPNNSDVTATYYPKQDLQWKTHPGCGTYTIEIDTTSTFTSPVKVRETWSSSVSTKEETRSQTVQDLYLGKMIYWRIRYYNQNDSSNWSETGQFHTLSKAKGTSPSGYTSAYTIQTFTWAYYKGLNNVIIELDTTDRFNSPAKRIEKSSGSSQDYCYQTISELFFGKDYYWRVKAYHQKDTTEWSDVLHFHTYNSCTLSTPKDSAENKLVTGKVWWKWSKGVSTYQVQMDTTSLFNSPSLINKLEGASSDDYAYYSYSELLFGQRYFWRVRECHSKDTSIWSETRTFTTYRHCTLNALPKDSATEVITSPYLYFDYTSGITYYQQQIDTTPTFDSPLMESKIETGSSGSDYNYARFEDLLFGKTYYRRVRECHSKDTSDWSPVHCFTTIVRGAYSTISGYASIANGATGQSVTPKLYYFYRSFIDSVEIQIDTTLNFDSPLLESIRVKEAGSQSYAYEYPKNKLLYGTIYYWRIRNSHSKDVSDWTFPRHFTTSYQLPQPALCEPVNQTIVNNGEVVDFVWKTCGDATKYIFQLSDDGQFTTCLHQEELTDTTTSLIPPTNSILYWRVQAIDSVGRSPWSNVWGLNTIAPSPTQLDGNHNDNDNHNHNHNRKVLINGHLYIIIDDKRYDATGSTID